MALLLFRVRYRVLGGHVHCRVFVAWDRASQPTWALSGELVFRVDEWDAAQPALEELGWDMQKDQHP
jgi:hypothetical protein